MKLLIVRQIYVDSFTKFIIKANIPYLSHLRLCQSKGTARGKEPIETVPLILRKSLMETP